MVEDIGGADAECGADVILFIAIILAVSSAKTQGRSAADFGLFTGNDFEAYCPKDSHSVPPGPAIPPADELLQSTACLMFINGYATGLNDGVPVPNPDSISGRTA